MQRFYREAYPRLNFSLSLRRFTAKAEVWNLFLMSPRRFAQASRGPGRIYTSVCVRACVCVHPSGRLYTWRMPNLEGLLAGKV